ncbi:hypothetical protein NUU61_008405 [Penicillium alfredii]|uniref:Uncharacterized protein n=1 Tax=Penicillium alfredii TaxID=1506179 RepID=A0A9W9ESB8_9EURO|nr:uncharacterized protein NUU61_008405 [Penicillium alfredii]KAJ5087098.1 hypothetical protein NUU61_008405 [Penicillium alfredii]
MPPAEIKGQKNRASTNQPSTEVESRLARTNALLQRAMPERVGSAILCAGESKTRTWQSDY